MFGKITNNISTTTPVKIKFMKRKTRFEKEEEEEEESESESVFEKLFFRYTDRILSVDLGHCLSHRDEIEETI